eukprot:scaffold363_cov331-Pavlova_lutheri.AAC.77
MVFTVFARAELPASDGTAGVTSIVSQSLPLDGTSSVPSPEVFGRARHQIRPEFHLDSSGRYTSHFDVEEHDRVLWLGFSQVPIHLCRHSTLPRSLPIDLFPLLVVSPHLPTGETHSSRSRGPTGRVSDPGETRACPPAPTRTGTRTTAACSTRDARSHTIPFASSVGRVSFREGDWVLSPSSLHVRRRSTRIGTGIFPVVFPFGGNRRRGDPRPRPMG